MLNKQKVTKLLSIAIATLEISKEFRRDYRTIKRATENITKLRSRRKGKGFNKLSRRGKINESELNGNNHL